MNRNLCLVPIWIQIVTNHFTLENNFLKAAIHNLKVRIADSEYFQTMPISISKILSTELKFQERGIDIDGPLSADSLLIKKNLKLLTPKEEKIIRLRFGIEENENDVENFPVTEEMKEYLLNA